MKTIIFIIAFIGIIAGGRYLLSQPPQESPANQTNPQTSQNPMEPKKVTVKTSRGDIVLELYPAVAPQTVENFVKLSKEGFYDGTKFHRVIPEFMIQGGDPLSKVDSPLAGTGGTGYAFKDEINPRSLGVREDVIKQYEAVGYTYDYSLTSLPVDVGSIAMANSGPNTNGSQFFIVTMQAQPHLYGKHTVFGKVIRGMDVVRAIKQGDAVQSVQILQ